MAVQAVDWVLVEGLPALLGIAWDAEEDMAVDGVGAAAGIPHHAIQTREIKASTLMTGPRWKPKKPIWKNGSNGLKPS